MSRRIFIASSLEAKDEADAIQENLEHYFECTVWSQDVFQPSQSTLESLEEKLESFDYAIFVFSPNDVLQSRGEEFSVVRDNIILEYGLFCGHLGRDHTYFIVPKDLELHLPSDLFGIQPLRYETKRDDENLSAALGPACTKIKRDINRHDDSLTRSARSQYDLLNHRYPRDISIRYLDTVCVFNSRASFESCIDIHGLFEQSKEIKAIGISLNTITLNWGTESLLDLIGNSASDVKLLFLQPDCDATKMREIDEGLRSGTISQLTQTNVNLVMKALDQLNGAKGCLQYKFYETIPFINMYIIDNNIIVLQHYLSGRRGQEAPVYVIREDGNKIGLFKIYNDLFFKIWNTYELA